MNIFDSDSDEFEITTSKSWATIDEQNNLILTPVDSGLHTINVIVNDSFNEVTESIMVDVSAKSDLLIESVTVRMNGVEISNAKDGDVVEIYAYIRNEGRGSANGIDVRCYVNDVLIDTQKIDTLQPGALVSTICDTALSGNDQDNTIRIIVDSTLSIDESNEDNNQEEIMIFISSPNIGTSDNSEKINKEPIIIGLSVVAILIFVAILQLGPNKINKPFDKRK
jgi:subtilase family serine protease